VEEMKTVGNEHDTFRFDTIIIGAGISGIGGGYYLKKNFPAKSFAILESRDCIGGTWELFKYPGLLAQFIGNQDSYCGPQPLNCFSGIRSDSSMNSMV
jgi:cation diffusion facilitator CzcD-associated flavoprotein CzcO